MTRTWLPLALFASLVGCGLDKPPADDTFDELAGLDEKSDAFSSRWRIVGSLDYGQTSDPVKYANPPRYRAFKFAGPGGDRIVVDVASKNGDTVAWVLDNDFRTLAANDDWRGSTNSHLELTLPANRSNTRYLVVREYSLEAMTFTVRLQGPPKPVDFYSCQLDRDCAKVEKGCCAVGAYTAIRADRTKEWRAALHCAPNPICPLLPIREDFSMAQCQQSRCTLVPVDQIRCAGFTQNPHACPGGYVCEVKAEPVDAPGQCTQQCAGKQGLACRGANQICVDDPRDGCNPNGGGVDCLGVCRDEICSGKTAKCALGYYWDQYHCTCLERLTCGGFGGLSCAAGKVCIDNPADGCDPNRGGADCPGICVPPDDCRVTGCGPGRQCSYCWRGFACIPIGAVC